MKILVTGGAGFIGSNLIEALNRGGSCNILIVDNLGSKLKADNLASLKFVDYLDKSDFRRRLATGDFDREHFQTIYHFGACTSTLENDAEYLMDNNYRYSKELVDFALAHTVPFIYASSAAVYGGSTIFREEPQHERPLNYYGLSKLALDKYVRELFPSVRSTLVGLRFFNVYGPREAHKGQMSSVIHKFLVQAWQSATIRVFKGTCGWSDGEQRRDFVYVDDVVNATLFFADREMSQGIFNVGTGHSRSFNDVAQTVIGLVGKGCVEYIDFPEQLRNKYQSWTQADLERLRAAGYSASATQLERGIELTIGRSLNK